MQIRADRAPTPLRPLARGLRRAAVALAGSGLVAVGLLLLVLPGPGTPVLLGGLAVLATEFAWAERALGRATATMGWLAMRRPSREAVVLTSTAVAGCAAIIATIAGVDELAGALAP
jgi:uncharacterized protein (TIGR02611 family)